MRVPGAPASNADTSEYQATLALPPSSRPKPAYVSVPGASTKHMGTPSGREGGQEKFEMGPPGKMGPPGARVKNTNGIEGECALVEVD